MVLRVDLVASKWEVEMPLPSIHPDETRWCQFQLNTVPYVLKKQRGWRWGCNLRTREPAGGMQRALLTNGLRLVRHGGRVVYSTCR
jgi:hypothetical protein